MESGFVKYEFSVLQMRDPGVESGGAATTPSLEGELKGVRGDGSAGATTTPSLEGELKGVREKRINKTPAPAGYHKESNTASALRMYEQENISSLRVLMEHAEQLPKRRRADWGGA